MVCPKCGGDCSSITYGDRENNKCPFCGHEVYDYSKEIYADKIEDVKEKRRKLLGVPMTVAVTILITLFVLVGGTIAYFTLHINSAVEDYTGNYSGDKYTKKMKKCYESGDMDGLYDIVILDFEHAINSEYYFTYSAAWYVYHFKPLFDEAYEKGDIAGMKDAYQSISMQYEFRQGDDSLFGSIYAEVDEIEESLKAEYERETEIMKKVEDK